MPMKELQTFTYIMYQENLERERRDEEERKMKQRAEADERNREAQQQEAGPPQNRAEMLLAAQRKREEMQIPQEPSKQIKFSNGEPVEPPTVGMDDLAEFLEDEF